MPLRTLFTPPLPVVHLIKCAGVDILSTYIGGAYQSLSGTSMVCINLPMSVYACVCACADVWGKLLKASLRTVCSEQSACGMVAASDKRRQHASNSPCCVSVSCAGDTFRDGRLPGVRADWRVPSWDCCWLHTSHDKQLPSGCGRCGGDTMCGIVLLTRLGVLKFLWTAAQCSQMVIWRCK